MIFLGLLGTFWGLLHTVSSVAAVINGMSLSGGDVNAMFAQLKAGLAGPLAGMGTAFSSSMFGLSGALILGFLDLTAGQAMNRFYNELEEWLAGLTRLSSGALAGDGEGSVPVYVQALLEQTAENMESLQRVLTRGEDSRLQANNVLQTLSERMGNLSETLRTNQQLMLKLAEAQVAIGPALNNLASVRSDAHDDISRAHLRNIELLLSRLLGETESGRIQSTAELRSDLKVLTRTIAALADGTRAS
ncbi:MAG: flagellar motor protein MotA, partial [Acidocella sp. 35-58-6]